MSKINILVVPSDRTGVSYYRSTIPHIKLEEYFPNDFKVDIDYESDLNDDSYLKQYDIIHYHRTLGDYDNLEKILDRCDKLGIVTIMDLDDHWSPGPDHPAWAIIQQHQLDKKILNNIKVSRHITTTTPLFADEISKFNKNVYVIPNAINTEEKQYNSNNEKSDRIRIGWLGGSSHLHDLMLLDGMVSKLSDIQKNIQFVVCGFDTRGTMTEFNQDTGEKKVRAIRPEETVWVKYEEIFTNKYKIVGDEYKTHLMKFKDESYHNELNENYRRVWTLPTTSYAKNYSKFDISLAPLKNHIFNRVKSQLKVIEAGFYKKALIASNVGPYSIDLIHSLDKGNFTDGNALLVDENKNHADWSKYVKKLVQNPNMITDMGERLYETVSARYDLNIVTKNRKELYFSLLK